jgi:nicotinamide phosphoribosyltransferase
VNLDNLILDVDSYKASHFQQYPPGTTALYSYIESRGGRYDYTRFFGLQYFIKRYLTKPVTMEDVEEAKALFATHGVPFPYAGWKKVVETHKGFLPVHIRAVPEGSVVPTHNVLATVESTDPDLYWIVTWLETQILRNVWYGTTVATRSYFIKQLIKGFLEQTSDDPEGQIPFKLHDFGARGVSSRESAGIGGLAHLTNFKGTDTIEALLFGAEYYNEPMAGFSIPAAEHSTMTAWGRSGEADAYRNMLRFLSQGYPLIAVVSDSYDLFSAIQNIWGKELKAEVVASGGTVVIRPDSGEPVATLLRVVQLLDEGYGSKVNRKGYKVLQHVRVTWGDGVNEDSIRGMLNILERYKYSADNVSFGMGGALLQRCDRDTQRFAMKASEVVVDGVRRAISKDPVTDPGKRSKSGRWELYKVDGQYVSALAGAENKTDGPKHEPQLVSFYRDGQVLRDDSLEDIRKRN